MANPTRMKSGVYYFVQRVPADLIAKVGDHRYSFSLKTKDPTEARSRFLEAAAQKDREHAALRAAPAAIPHKELLALAGQAYRDFVTALETEPGEESVWEAYRGLMERLASAEPNARDLWYGQEADKRLLQAGLAADEYSRARLIDELHKAYRLAGEYQAKRAGGDYGPDPNAARFPTPSDSVASKEAPAKKKPNGVTITSLFEFWKMDHVAAGRSASTVDEYESKTKALIKWLGHDEALRVEGESLSDYLDHVQGDRGLSPKTVGDKYLPHIKAIFRAGEIRKKIPSNPATGIRRIIPDAVVSRSKGFTDEEAKTILTAALRSSQAEDGRSETNKLACRWIPWLCAYAGARVTEMAQLRKEDVRQEYGVWLMSLTPDAGSVKNRQYRLVPVHPDLIKQGFIDFVNAHADGPLFYHPNSNRRGTKSSQASEVSKTVGRWVKSLFTTYDHGLQPNHAWRHRFKTVGRDVGMDLYYLNRLQGHSDGSAAAGYGETTIKALDREMRRMPTIKVD